MNPRLRGRGVDIDAKLVDESNQRAKAEGLGGTGCASNAGMSFDTDLREATVVTMWLFPELMRLLRPIILERARPGTQVLTTTWNLGSWKPDQVSTDEPTVYMWIVPARVAGSWEWTLDLNGTPRPATPPYWNSVFRRRKASHARVTDEKCSKP